MYSKFSIVEFTDTHDTHTLKNNLQTASTIENFPKKRGRPQKHAPKSKTCMIIKSTETIPYSIISITPKKNKQKKQKIVDSLHVCPPSDHTSKSTFHDDSSSSIFACADEFQNLAHETFPQPPFSSHNTNPCILPYIYSKTNISTNITTLSAPSTITRKIRYSISIHELLN